MSANQSGAPLNSVSYTGGPFGFLVGTTQPFDAATLARLYPGGKADYLKKFDASLGAAVKGGFILPADQAEKGRQHVGAAGQAGEEEVEQDVPGPLRSAHEVLRRGEKHHGAPLRLKATMPATTPSTAVTSAPRYPPRSLRLGRPALAASGSPYFSGLSMRRKKAFRPP